VSPPSLNDSESLEAALLNAAKQGVDIVSVDVEVRLWMSKAPRISCRRATGPSGFRHRPARSASAGGGSLRFFADTGASAESSSPCHKTAVENQVAAMVNLQSEVQQPGARPVCIDSHGGTRTVRP